MNSLFRRENSLFSHAQGICLQRTEIAAQIDLKMAESARNRRNFGKFPVKFPVLREFGDRVGWALRPRVHGAVHVVQAQCPRGPGVGKIAGAVGANTIATGGDFAHPTYRSV
jgi:hypothetical protein